VADDSVAAEPLAEASAESTAVPTAVWDARVPELPWCPDALVTALEPAFVARAAAEPRVVTQTGAGWRVLGASLRGKAHAHRGEYRDDALAVHGDDTLLVLAVADGAGSSALSRVGAAVSAEIAVAQTVARFRTSHPGEPEGARLGTAMAHAVHDAALRLHALATAADVSPAAFRTTLLLVAILGDLMLVAQVGDGAVLVQRRDGTVTRVGAMRETAWAGEVSCFVPDACAMTQAAELRQLRASDVALIALMTDGVDDPFHPLEQSGEALVAQWRHGTSASIGTAQQPPAASVLGSPDDLVRWLSFEQRGEVDDRTLLLAWRTDETPA
jgi:hypothetical protein